MSDKTELHAEIMKRFDSAQNYVQDEREQCIEDRRFYSIAGAQWEGDLSQQFENKPKFEVNKIHLSVIRIFNEYRNNRITVNFVPKDGSENDKLAETCASLYRADEQASVAEEAYDNAFEEAVGGGFGAWRLRTKYEDEEDEDDDSQRICIEPIYDADSTVFFDANSKRYDKSDAKYCFVVTSYTKDAYEQEFGETPPATMPTIVLDTSYDWVIDDAVRVAEYYVVEEQKEKVFVYEGLTGEEARHLESDIKEDASILEVLTATGFTKVSEKKIKRRRIHKYIVDGQRILEDCGYLVGKHIPIVPVYGKRWVVDGIERCMGHVRLSKDAQRLKNMQISKIGEIAGMSATSKPVFVTEQMVGREQMWADDNIINYPYLLVNALKDAGGNPLPAQPAMYTKPPEIPPAMAALVQLTEADMQDLLGNQQAGEQIQPNISGKAIELIQNKLDMQTFIYMSNMSKSVKRCGEIWLSMAKEVFSQHGRKVKGLGANNEPQSVELMRRIVTPKGEMTMENDLSKGDFDVAVDVGASSVSKRQTTVRNLMGMLQITQDPETTQVLGAMAMLNMEGEGISDVRDFFRQKLVRMGAIKPTEEELQEMQQEQQNRVPDPQAQFLQASAQQAEAQAAKARADTVLTMAKSEETRAKTAQTLSNMDLSARKSLIEALRFADDISSKESITRGAGESLGAGGSSGAAVGAPENQPMS